MAKKSAAKKSAKTKKPQVKLPALGCKTVAHTHITMSGEWTGKMATRLASFQEDYASWRKSQRAALRQGTPATPFPSSSLPNPNEDRLSYDEYVEVIEKHNSGEMVDLGPSYNPVQVDLIAALDCPSIQKTRLKQAPENWNEKNFGPWLRLDDEGNRTLPSQLDVVNDSPRRSHSESILTLIDRPDGNDISDNPNVVTLGNVRYIIGGGKANESAVYLVSAHRGGDFGRIDSTRKRMSLARCSGLANIVGRIEDKPNLGGAVMVWLDSENNICFMPGQVVTWGYLSSDKELTPAAIRKAVEEGTRGIKFSALKEPIVGTATPWTTGLWPEISKAAGNKGSQEKSMNNSQTTLRTDPMTARFVNGFSSVQIGIMPFQVVTGTGKNDFSQGVVVGARSSYEYTVMKNEFKREAREADENPKKARKSKVTTVDAPAEVEEVVVETPVEPIEVGPVEAKMEAEIEDEAIHAAESEALEN